MRESSLKSKAHQTGDEEAGTMTRLRGHSSSFHNKRAFCRYRSANSIFTARG